MATGFHLIARCGLALTLLGCGDIITEPVYEGADVRLLTPDVALQLDARGRFPEQQVEAGYLNPRSRVDADSLARRHIAAADASQREAWEDQRGAAIDAARLRRCSPIRYSRSAYEVAEFTEDQPWRQAVGGQYWMIFCGTDGRPAVRIQVPVEPVLPAGGFSGDLAGVLSTGVAIEGESFALIGPEEAVRLVAGRTGRRVAAVPEFVNERFLFGGPRWLVQLESPVQVFGSETLQTHSMDFAVVGYRGFGSGPSSPPAALRPYGLPTPEAQRDTIYVMEGIPIDIYTVRTGVPRWLEPFMLVNP